jgi:hypothetical protein
VSRGRASRLDRAWRTPEQKLTTGLLGVAGVVMAVATSTGLR